MDEMSTLHQKKSMFCKVGGAIDALSLCRDNSKIVVAGRALLKVFFIDESSSKFIEELKLYPIYAARKQNLNVSSTDVAWCPHEDNLIATAALNGAVVIWDINLHSSNKQLTVFPAHQRTVTKVSFHPAELHKLISGSQDGSVKMFDLRKNEYISTFNGKGDGVRNVQFSPHNYFQFAASFDNGNVQIWDYRRTNTFLSQFIAHKGSVHTLDWHPDPEENNTLATGGRDNVVKIWDLTNAIKQKNDIPIASAVVGLCWRPSRRQQLATAASSQDLNINVWDLRRKYVPFAYLDDHRDVPTAISWKHNDPSVLLSCFKDGVLFMHSMKNAVRPGDDTETRGLAFSSRGYICVAEGPPNSYLSRSPSPTGSGIIPSLLVPWKSSGSDYEDAVQPSFPSMTSNYKIKNFLRNQSCLKMISVLTMEPKASADINDYLESNDVLLEHLYMKGFRYAAQNYILDGSTSEKSFFQACEYNARVALIVGMANAARTWFLIAQFYPQSSHSSAAYSKLSNGTSLTRTYSDITGDKIKRNENDGKRSSILSKRNESHGSQIFNLGASGAESEIPSEEERVEMEDYLTDIAKGRHSEPEFYFSDDDVLPSFGDDAMTSEADFLTDQEWGNIRVPSEAIVQKEVLDANSFAKFGHVVAPQAVVNKSVSKRTIFTPHSGRWHATSVKEETSQSSSPPADINSLQLNDKDLVVKPSLWPDPVEAIRDDLICKQLKWLAENNDVQTAVSIILVLSSFSVMSEFPCEDEFLIEHWQLSYLDLLAKHQLWLIHEMVIRLSKVRSIREISTSSVVQVACSTCRRRMPANNSWSCDRRFEPDHDNRAASCFLCNLPVTGLYTYCQGCSLGGHLKCVELWISRREMRFCRFHCV